MSHVDFNEMAMSPVITFAISMSISEEPKVAFRI